MYSNVSLYFLQRIAGTKVFGVPLASLVSEKDKVPGFLENLITSIELHGLYTEGIYRKSGSANKIKKLKDALDLGNTGTKLTIYLFNTGHQPPLNVE